MSKKAWISAGKASAALAAVALMLGVFFQGQAQQRSDMADMRAQQRSDMADMRAELRNGFADVNRRFSEVNSRFAEVNGRFTEVSGRFDSVDRDLSNLRERVARIEGHLALPGDTASQANAAP